jgi:hypothetical protein
MTSPIVPPLPVVSGGLHLRRCARHTTREAAARCPSCGQFFCRECIVEHEGRLLCAACLAKVGGANERRRQRWAVMRRIATATASAIVLWVSFELMGSLLLKVPPAFHEGTVWKELLDRTPP